MRVMDQKVLYIQSGCGEVIKLRALNNDLGLIFWQGHINPALIFHWESSTKVGHNAGLIYKVDFLQVP